MVNVIETNLNVGPDCFITDFQSRVVKAESWEEYIRCFENYNGQAVNKFETVTNMVGNSIPENVEITNLTHDDRHLSCEIHKDNFINYKLAYRCEFT